MTPLPVTGQAKQKEWNTILTISKNNGFPLQTIHNLKNKLTLKTQQTKATTTQKQQWKKWPTFIYYSPLVYKTTNLFKYTNLNIGFRATNILYNNLCNKAPQNKMNSSGIYRRKCKTCNGSYVGQTGSF
jgi:hypothetical protein